MSLRDGLLLTAGLWLAWAALISGVIAPWLRRAPDGTAFGGLLWVAVRLYCRLWQRLEVVGRDLIPTPDQVRETGLIVVANHTGALDPLLVQADCRFVVYWMMAREMMAPNLEFMWRREYVIPLDRDGTDSGPLRTAIRKAKHGQAVGIFPEGRITMPPGELRPFLPGAGVLIARSKAPVLLAWISGTPETNLMGPALKTRSHARVEYLGVLDYSHERDAKAIADDLRRRLAEHSGWPLNDEVLPPGG